MEASFQEIWSVLIDFERYKDLQRGVNDVARDLKACVEQIKKGQAV
ncbi:MAG TPA: hypothetical protein VFN23_08795 [Ktedonobacteraceae bacterium]|nr:hypothetical protein [Ktedonobacteraceae bacterium]